MSANSTVAHEGGVLRLLTAFSWQSIVNGPRHAGMVLRAVLYAAGLTGERGVSSSQRHGQDWRKFSLGGVLWPKDT